MPALSREEDAFGQALYAAFMSGQDCVIIERDDGCIYDGGGLKPYFAAYNKWPKREREAMKYAHGKVIDLGAGAGRHSLYLQKKGFDVTATDNSPVAVKLCRERGVKNAVCLPVEEISVLKDVYDTVLMMCNNFGLFGTERKAKRLLRTLYGKTSGAARIIAESYEYKTPFFRGYILRNKKLGRQPGDFRARIRYGKFRTPWFNYFRVTKKEMAGVLKDTGWEIERFIDKGEPSYLAVIKKKRKIGGNMPVMLAHACLDVRSLEKSIIFYGKLDLKVVYKFKDKTGRDYGVYLKAGRGTFLEMFRLNKKLVRKFKPAGYFHLCFQVKNIEAAAKMMRRKRIKIIERIEWGGNGRLFFINDPDGNKLEFLQYLGKNPLLKQMK